MRSGDLAFWLLWGAGSLTFLACVAILWWGLFGDRARGRRRCPRCWYDMSHSDGMTCPECGRTAKHERQLFRTRRRLIPALLAAVIAATAASYAIERGNQRGWLAIMPTRLVLLSLPFSGDSNASLGAEISTRLARGTMSDGQVKALVKRCLRGDFFARPVSPEWEHKYGTLLNNCRGSLPEGSDFDEQLLDLPARIELTSRRAWPRDAPVCLNLDVREWWPAGTECRVTLTPRWAPDDPITIWRDAAPRWGARRSLRGFNAQREYPLVIRNPPGEPRLEFDAVLERLVPGEHPAWEQTQEMTLTVDVELAGTLTELLTPATSEQLDEAMKATFRRGVVKWTGGRSPVRVHFDRQRTYEVETDEDVVIGAVVDIMRGDTLARSLELWWPLVPTSPDDVGFVVAYEDETLIKDANDLDGLWNMRVHGEPAVALRAGDGSAYWAGSFTVPLRVGPLDTVAPRKYWWREQDGVSR